MSSVSEGKRCETHEDLGYEVKGIDETLDSSWDEMMCVKEEEIYSNWRAGMMSLSDDNDFLKLRDFIFECEKTDSNFSRKDLVLKVGFSENNSIDGVSRIVGKEGM